MKKFNLKDIGEYEVLDEQSPSSSSPININDLEGGYDVIDSNVNKVESLIRGVKQGATLGLADELYGAGRAVIGDDLYSKAKDYLGEGVADYLAGTATTIGLPVAVGGRVLNELYNLATTDKKLEDIKEQFKKDYAKGRDEYREADKIAQEANPKTYIGGNIAGGVATSLIPVGGAVKGVGLVGRAALEGAVAGAGYSEGQNAKEVLQDAVVGGVVGGALGYGAHKLGQTITKNTANKLNIGSDTKDLQEKALKVATKHKLLNKTAEEVYDTTTKKVSDINDLIAARMASRKPIKLSSEEVASLVNEISNIVDGDILKTTTPSQINFFNSIRDQITKVKTTADLSFAYKNIKELKNQAVQGASNNTKDVINYIESEARNAIIKKIEPHILEVVEDRLKDPIAKAFEEKNILNTIAQNALKVVAKNKTNNLSTKDLGAFILGQGMIGDLIGGGVGVLGYRIAQKGLEKASPYLYPAVDKLKNNPKIARIMEAALKRGISPQVAHYLYYNNVKDYREKVRNLLGEDDDKE
jgi:hypothetical protein